MLKRAHLSPIHPDGTAVKFYKVSTLQKKIVIMLKGRIRYSPNVYAEYRNH